MPIMLRACEMWAKFKLNYKLTNYYGVLEHQQNIHPNWHHTRISHNSSPSFEIIDACEQISLFQNSFDVWYLMSLPVAGLCNFYAAIYDYFVALSNDHDVELIL